MAVVLLIDNNLETCRVLGRLLQEHGHEVLLVPSAYRAMQMLQSVAPDVILLDVNMPEISGLELLGILRADTRYRGVPVIMCTSVADPEVGKQALDLGARDYVVKGLDWQGLVKRVNALASPAASSDEAGHSAPL